MSTYSTPPTRKSWTWHPSQQSGFKLCLPSRSLRICQTAASIWNLGQLSFAKVPSPFLCFNPQITSSTCTHFLYFGDLNVFPDFPSSLGAFLSSCLIKTLFPLPSQGLSPTARLWIDGFASCLANLTRQVILLPLSNPIFNSRMAWDERLLRTVPCPMWLSPGS